MTLTIDLPDEEIKALAAKAEAQGISAEQYARRVLAHDLETSPPHIWDVIAENMKRLNAAIAPVTKATLSCAQEIISHSSGRRMPTARLGIACERRQAAAVLPTL